MDQIYGLACLCAMGARAIWEGTIRRPPSGAFWVKVEEHRTRLWSLSRSPDRDVDHAWYTNTAGHLVHYIHNPASKQTETLVVFVHGYPDSCHLWHSVWSELEQVRTFESSSTTKLIAVDLPGFGGSDDIERYGPDQVLGWLLEFVAGMREDYLSNGVGKVVLVAHDWGAVAAWRLAAEVPEVADRFVLANGPPVRAPIFIELPMQVHKCLLYGIQTMLAKQNFYSCFSTAGLHCRAWLSNPLRGSHLSDAFRVVRPAISQLVRSAYIFVFRLPLPLSSFAFSLGDHFFIRKVCELGVVGSRSVGSSTCAKAGTQRVSEVENAIARQLAGALGPNAGALATSTQQADGSTRTYPQSVRQRVLKRGGRSAVEADAILYYQHGLATEAWQQSERTKATIETLRSLRGPSTPNESNEMQSFRSPDMPKAPVKLIWGAQDPALDERIMLRGIDEWVSGWQNVVVLKNVGHFAPSERGDGLRVGEGTIVLAKAVAEAVDLVQAA